jgi:hypothetical protein
MNGETTRSRFPLVPVPGMTGPVAAQPSISRIARRERRPIVSRVNPWRWELV